LFREIIIAYFENHKNTTNAPCVQGFVAIKALLDATSIDEA
jgi:hypothetical protein